MPTISPREGQVVPSPSSARGVAAQIAAWVPAVYAALAPTLFLPFSVDAYILPRTGLTLLAAAILVGLGLVAGRGSLGRLRWPALAVAVTALLAAALSFAPNLSLFGEYSRYESFPVRLAYLGLFAGVVWISGGSGAQGWVVRQRVVAWFLVGCAVASVEALLQWATGSLPRPDGNLGQANLLGALLAMAVPLSLDRALWTPALQPGGAAGRRSRGRRPEWWLVVTGLCGLGLLVSSSRSGWLGALVGLCVLALFRVPPRRLRLALASAAAIIAIALAVGLASPLRLLNQDTGSGRLGVWKDTVSLVAARPLLGWGEDSLGVVFGRYQTQNWTGQSFDRAHSMPLDLAASQGLLGLGACTWFFLAIWRGLWRRPELAALAGALAAYLAWSLLNFDWAPATGPFWLLAGLAWAGVSYPPSPQPSPRRGEGARVEGERRSRESAGVEGVRWWRPVVGVAAGVVALALVLPAQVADVLYYEGRPQQAVALDPLQPRYQAALGTVVGLQRAAGLHDTDPSVYVQLGDALLKEGDRQGARAAYEEALRIYPYQQDAAVKLSTVR